MTVPVSGRWLALATVIAVSTGCVSHAGLRKQYLDSRKDIIAGDWAGAASQYLAAKGSLFKERDRVMYWLNLGTLQHYAGQWAKSQANFVKAERAIQDLFTTSITAEASKYTVSETLAPYEGEDFEKILLYFYTALNSVNLGRVQDALVEARRADELLRKVRLQYDKNKKISTLYKQDAFMLWLVGLFYEIEGSYSDAYLAYRRAYEVYEGDYRHLFRTRIPSYVAEDVVRTGRLANLVDEAQNFAQRTNVRGDSIEKMQSHAEVIFIHAGGEAPHKKERFITTPMPDGYLLRIALPEFEPSKPMVIRSSVEIAGEEASPELAEPVSRIALKNFKHQLSAINARAIARATVKYVATQGTKKAIKGGKKASSERKLAGALVGLFGNLAAAASENADLRSWSLLPAYFRVTRMWVPAGRHTMTVRFFDKTGAEPDPPQRVDLSLGPGQKKIISLRTVR